MDNFNQPNNTDYSGYNNPAADSGYSPSGQPASSGEYNIRYQPGTNVYRTTEQQPYQEQYQLPYNTRQYDTSSSAASHSSFEQFMEERRAAQEAKEHKKSLGNLFWGILICVIVTGAVIAGIRFASDLIDRTPAGDDSDNSVTLEVTESPSTNIDYIPSSGELLNYAQIAAKFRSAVVSVTVYYNAYGWGSYVYSEGSGFIIDEAGYIVTNSHVIDDDNHDEFDITVTIADADGSMNEVEAIVIGNDARTDLAVLKIDPTGLDLVVSELGQSSSLVLGDEVVAIGNPGGAQFAGSITNGIISGIDRIIDSDSGTADNAMKYLQTNAAINPGNSGGPLLNMYGQVIGINTAKIVDEGYESLGFAIPIDTALPIIRELIEVGSVARPALGVSCTEISTQTAQWYDVPVGLLIRGFYSKSTLPYAGVQVGDIIVACDGEETANLLHLQYALEAKEVGDTITLTIFRPGQDDTFDVEVTLIADNDTGSLLPSSNGRP